MSGRPSQTYSVAERVLKRVFDVLLSAGTEAGTFVSRGRVDGHSFDELPAINLRRSTGLNEALGQGVDKATLEFEVDHLVSGDDWETAADALHCETHAALAADPDLARLGKGLRCIRTDPRGQAADETRGTLTATYQIQSLHRVSDITAQP
jgi:hypothetical protein